MHMHSVLQVFHYTRYGVLTPMGIPGTSIISFVNGKTEIFHNFPDSTGGLVYILDVAWDD